MSASPATALIRHLRKFAGAVNADDATDRELLHRYATERDEDAFAALVRRHGAMVWNVCRRVLNQSQDVEDAFQAAFLVLAQKAGAVRWKESVAPWMYVVAGRLARKVRLAQRSRPKLPPHEEAVADPLAEMSARELLSALDEEMAALPTAHLGPLILCWQEGKTQEEAARLLGVSLSTVRRNLERGRKLLHARLTRRGLSLSIGSLATGVWVQAASAVVPVVVVDTTVRAGKLIAAGHTAFDAIASSSVLALTNGALKAMSVSKLKAMMIVLLLVVLTGLGGLTTLTLAREAQPQPGARKRFPPQQDLLVMAPLPPEKKRANDEVTLQGMWTMKEAQANGKHLPDEVDLNQTWTFKDGKIVIRRLDGSKDEWTFKLDAASTPRAIDLRSTAGIRAGQDAPGIYELNGESLRVCLSWGQPQKRPKQFDSFGDDLQEDRGRRLFVLERPTLQQRLALLEGMRVVGKVDYEELEKQGQELIARYTKPEEQAKIYFQITHLYGQSGIHLHPDRVTKYARLALKNERDAIQRAWLHMYLGCAAEVDPDASLRNFDVKRRRATTAYLEGYKEALALKLPDKAPELPVVGKLGDIDDGLTPEEQKKIRELHEERWKARREAERIRELVGHRDILIRQIVELYRRPPADEAELRHLAGEILGDRKVVEDLIARVRQK